MESVLRVYAVWHLICVIAVLWFNTDVRHPNWGLVVFRLLFAGIVVPIGLVKVVAETWRERRRR